MNLEKSLLKNVLRGGAVAKLALEEPEQFGLITPDERLHRLALTHAVGLHKLFVGSLDHVCSQGADSSKIEARHVAKSRSNQQAGAW